MVNTCLACAHKNIFRVEHFYLWLTLAPSILNSENFSLHQSEQSAQILARLFQMFEWVENKDDNGTIFK